MKVVSRPVETTGLALAIVSTEYVDCDTSKGAGAAQAPSSRDNTTALNKRPGGAVHRYSRLILAEAHGFSISSLRSLAASLNARSAPTSSGTPGPKLST